MGRERERERERGITMSDTSYSTKRKKKKRHNMRSSRTNYQTSLRGDEKREEGIGDYNPPLWIFFWGRGKNSRRFGWVLPSKPIFFN
jgi:hypothetical protein